MIEKAGLFKPDSLSEALDLLATVKNAKLLAGGASLIAMINARILEPAALVSLEKIRELKGVRTLPSGEVVIGASVRHRDIAVEARLSGTLAVVSDAAGQIANATIRNMGTIGGAIAHADPALDFPPALIAAEAVIEVASATDRRRISVAEFFVDWYTTALKPGEIVVAVHLPKAKPGVGIYLKHKRVAGDFAIVSVAVSLARTGEAHVAVGGCGPTPLVSAEADQVLSSAISDAALAQAGQLLSALADPIDDVRGSAEYRLMLIPRMLRRAMLDATAASMSAA
jgi:aerobic carbon-monoxide dehydrogenase medium subunit